MPPCASIRLDDQHHGDAFDDADRSSASRLASSAPPSRRRPSVGDRDHLGAMFHESYDAGDRSLASSSASKCCRATTGWRSGLPA